MKKLAFLALAVVLQTVSAAACDGSFLDITRDGHSIEGSETRVTYARTPEVQRKGLSGIRNMPQDAGMVFVFDPPREISFWMKDTYIPLDILFADEAGKILNIHENAIPEDRSLIPSGAPIAYALEIRGGRSSELAVGEGDVLRSSVISGSCGIPAD